MNARNTKDKFGFFISCAWWICIAWICYKNTIFRCVETYSLNESRWILFIFVAICFMIGIILQWNKKRNNINILSIIAAGFGGYTVLTYLPIKKKLIIVTFLFTAGLALAYAVLILCQRIKNKYKFKRIVIRRIKLSLIGSRNIICAGLLAIMAMIGVNSVLGFSLLTPSVSPAKQSNVDEQTIANNIETLALLYGETWSSLNVDERLDVLQTVANIEQRYLGIPNELNVGAENLREGLAGYYSDRSHMIIVSLDSLLSDSSYKLVEIIAHESYHSFQYRMIDAYEEASEKMKPLLMFYEASIWKEEFANYTNGKKDFDDYYTQEVEVSARRYARSATNEYFERIYEYLGICSSKSADVTNVIYDEGKAYLVDENDHRIAGPYSFIEVSPYSGRYSYYRYIGDNGLIGYLDNKGNQVTEPIYLEASDLSSGVAMVRENEDSCFYINMFGKRISQDFADGYEFDSYCNFARVMTNDGKWGIIDSFGSLIYSGADKIEELWESADITTAIVDGNAVILKLFSTDDQSATGAYAEVVATIPDCHDVSAIHRGDFAIITDAIGSKGVMDIEGKILIPKNYAAIEYEFILGYGTEKEVVVFRLTENDGSLSFMNIEF